MPYNMFGSYFFLELGLTSFAMVQCYFICNGWVLLQFKWFCLTLFTMSQTYFMYTVVVLLHLLCFSVT